MKQNCEENRIWYYTELACFNIIIILLNFVKSEIKRVMNYSLFEMFILCLMRVRLSVLVIDLADRFQISKPIAADIFLEILNISIKLSPLTIWQEHPELQIFMPISFRIKFDSKITAVVD